jgi:hypothetical protein
MCGEVAEANELDNIGHDGTVTVLPSLPNLVSLPDPDSGPIIGFDPNPVKPGDSLHLAGTVSEVNGVNAGPFYVSFFLSPDTTITWDDYYVGFYDFASGLSGSATQNFDVTTTFPSSIPAGTYYKGIMIDSGYGGAGEVTETREDDNRPVAYEKVTVLAKTSNIGVFRSGTWYLDASGNGAWGAGDKSYAFGKAGDLAVSGDWNGDGKAEIGVYRSGTWYLDASGNGAWGAGDKSYAFGKTGDQPVTGFWS